MLFAVAARARRRRSARTTPRVQLGHAIAGRGRCLVDPRQLRAGRGARRRRRSAAGSTARAEAAFVVTSRERLHLRRRGACSRSSRCRCDDAMRSSCSRRARARSGPTSSLDAANRADGRGGRAPARRPAARDRAGGGARAGAVARAARSSGMRDRFALLAARAARRRGRRRCAAAIDWSWELLTPWEQAALAQCSVFEGGFTLEAAEAVLDLSAWPRGAAGDRRGPGAGRQEPAARAGCRRDTSALRPRRAVLRHVPEHPASTRRAS